MTVLNVLSAAIEGSGKIVSTMATPQEPKDTYFVIAGSQKVS